MYIRNQLPAFILCSLKQIASIRFILPECTNIQNLIVYFPYALTIILIQKIIHCIVIMND